MAKFKKILIANRGEIAVRILRTAREMGYETIAVYSDSDAHALHMEMADIAVPLHGCTVEETYLNMDKIITAAKENGADAVHPGYGFLSENAEFVQKCEQAGLVFIGPPASVVELMASKHLSKLAMQAAGVPCIPGYQGDDQRLETLCRAADEIGYPLMIKASAGGGGRGMRIVKTASECREKIIQAKSEAKTGFGHDELILEKALQDARHIEVQIFADQHGNVVHLGERDCSVQRRHQKVIEETPAPGLDDTVRKALTEAALKAARSCEYTGAGTGEFLLDNQNKFYFLEMNTRL
ncbi:MAG TPA: ATP-grasp domain-containing protein, partial [Hellea balneolensis]|nr:ATP-grasp domain-containing protein [Hellea balneolensis]